MTFRTAGLLTLQAALPALHNVATGLELDITQAQYIRNVSSIVAYGITSSYTENNTDDIPGNLSDPCHWWHAGAMFMTMVDYWYYTGDNSYAEATKQAILHQAGPEHDFMPQNQTKPEGNDQQLFWALAATSAAEVRFPNHRGQQASCLTRAQNAFDLQASPWATDECGGGPRWQYVLDANHSRSDPPQRACVYGVFLASTSNHTGAAVWRARSEKLFATGFDPAAAAAVVVEVAWEPRTACDVGVLMVERGGVASPVSGAAGGTSKPEAGGGAGAGVDAEPGNEAGVGVLALFVAAATVGTAYWML